MAEPSDQPGTGIRAGDKVRLRDGDPRKVGDVAGLYPMYGGWPTAGTVDVLFVVAWVSWKGEKTLERVDDLIKLPDLDSLAAQPAPDDGEQRR